MWLALREGNAVYRLDLKRGTIHHEAGTGKKGFTGNGGPAKAASLVPTSRFARPIVAAFLYPMIALSGLFFTLDQFPSSLQIVAWGLPTTHSVTLMQGIWDGSGWTAHWGSVAGLILMFGVCVWISTKVFRWE